MISHDRAQELISARMDAPLTQAEHRELQGHLATCTACRDFVMQADELARGLQVMPRLAPSPMVSRAVMQAISTDNSGWGWLRRGLQTLSSPGMAVASSLALVVALASALIVALNAPGSNNPGQGVAPKGTIAALADQTMPTEVPTVAPEVPTPPPTQVAESQRLTDAPPTATRGTGRTIAPKATSEPTRTPKPQPTATSVPIVPAANPPTADAPVIEPSEGSDVIYDPAAEEPALAMASDTGESAASAELAQEAVIEQPAENADTGEVVEPVASEPEGDVASAADTTTQESDSGRKGNGKKDVPVAETVEPEPTRPIGPVPAEAIRALEGAGNAAPDIYLPPAPIDPSMPDQSFLPETPTPEWEGTPTPESDPAASEAAAPQLAEDSSDDLGITALAPEAPVLAEAPDSTTVEEARIKEREKRDRSSKDGKSHEEQQAAFVQEPMAWSSEPVALQQTAEEPVELQQTTETPADTTMTGETAESATAAIDPALEEPVRQIDPATGMEIDPATGYLIDPTTGYLLDVANHRIIDPRTSYEVHPMTGLLIDPATGAMLDPNTLAVVIPAGFGDDQPAYDPGSDEMHGDIEAVVDDTYNNASIKLEPPTDGPVQPVGEIVVPTESGEALEIS